MNIAVFGNTYERSIYFLRLLLDIILAKNKEEITLSAGMPIFFVKLSNGDIYRAITATASDFDDKFEFDKVYIDTEIPIEIVSKFIRPSVANSKLPREERIDYIY